MGSQAHFTPGLFQFLKDLKSHNNRDWFEKNRPRYEADVKGPLLRFIAHLDAQLRRISPHVTAAPRRGVDVSDSPGHPLLQRQEPLQDERGRAFPPPPGGAGRACPRILPAPRTRPLFRWRRPLPSPFNPPPQYPTP